MAKLGRKEDALSLAWAAFERDPNDLSFEVLMRHVPRIERPAWQERAIAAAEKAGLNCFISLCVLVKDWDRIGGKVHSTQPAVLEDLDPFYGVPAAKGLARRDPLAAARLYRASALSLLKTAKSRTYGAALNHLEKARALYGTAGQQADWEVLAGTVRALHSRKRGFIADFDRIGARSTPRLLPAPRPLPLRHGNDGPASVHERRGGLRRFLAPDSRFSSSRPARYGGGCPAPGRNGFAKDTVVIFSRQAIQH